MKPRLDATSADVDYFNPFQLRRLLLLASGAASRLAEITDFEEASRLLVELSAARGEPEQDLLGIAAAPATSLKELRRIKNLAKRMLDDAPQAAQAAAARLLYHVAVAAAFGRCAVDISSRPLAGRQVMYERLALVFSGQPIANVFRHAADRIARL
ncbi:MAG: hypothetical protein JSU08_15510 [Acidobacteria bacterium]|nr:hypothetical protein [Acidobacteriota bacterium]